MTVDVPASPPADGLSFCARFEGILMLAKGYMWMWFVAFWISIFSSILTAVAGNKLASQSDMKILSLCAIVLPAGFLVTLFRPVSSCLLCRYLMGAIKQEWDECVRSGCSDAQTRDAMLKRIDDLRSRVQSAGSISGKSKDE